MKKLKTGGLILSNTEENEDITPKNEIWLNPKFQANMIKINTVPTVYKVKTIYDFKESEQQ